VPGRKPSAVVVLGERFSVGSWRDVVQNVLQTIATLDPDMFETLVQQFPNFLSRDASKLRSSRLLGNDVYFNTNFSGDTARRLCSQVVEAAGLAQDDYRVEFADLFQ
jgi:hypothetical protein